MININLLPPELKLKRLQAKRNASLVSVCIVVVITVVVIGIIGKAAKDTINTHLGATETNIQQTVNQQKENKSLVDMALLINDRAQATTQTNAKRAIWSQVLQELSNDSPADVQFRTVTANSEKTPNFMLAGVTTSEVEIIKFKEKLEASGFFKNVTFTKSTLTQATPGQAQSVTFNLEFDLAKFASNSGSTK